MYRSKYAIYLAVLAILTGCGLSIGHLEIKGVPFMNQISKMKSITEDGFYSIFYTWPFIHHISTFSFGILVGYLIRFRPNIPLGGRVGEFLLTVSFTMMSVLGFYWTQNMLKSSDTVSSLDHSGSTFEVYLNITVGKLMFCSGFLWFFYYCCTKRWGK